jgi:hypothetical protein
MIRNHLTAAARLAREASQGRRTIEIVVTEGGVLVRGRTVIDDRQGNAWHVVGWQELSQAVVDVASDAVMAVDRELSAMEGAAA